MPKTTAVLGTKLPPEWFNAVNSPQFNDGDNDGENPRLTDDALSNAAGNIKPQWRGFRDELLVTGVSGLIVGWTAGKATLPDGSIASISAGQISLPANATVFVYVTETGTIAASGDYPLRGVALARVTTNASAIVGPIDDLRPRYKISPVAKAIRILGGSGAGGNYNLTSGSATLSGEFEFRDFTVAAGATLTISGAAQIRVSGDLNLAGTINVTPPVRGGSAFTGVFGPQVYPNTQGSGIGGGGTVNGAASATYSYLASQLGSGGAGPWMAIGTQGGGQLTTNRGGNGGGFIEFEVGGIVNISGAINADGGNATSTVTGTSGYTGQISGAGGGSGGLILIKSITSIVVTAAGQLSVRGGNGGNGWPNPTGQFSGGGGGGGYIVLIAPSVNTSGAALLTSGGTSTYATGFGAVAGGSFGGAGGGPGQAGSSGQIIIRNQIPG